MHNYKMATTKFHSNVGDIVPWQAQYTFPSQTTRSQKQTVKLVPKNGSTFNPRNNRIRIEFPSDGYMNLMNSVLRFDLQAIPAFFPVSVQSTLQEVGSASGQTLIEFDNTSYTTQISPADGSSINLVQYFAAAGGLNGCLIYAKNLAGDENTQGGFPSQIQKSLIGVVDDCRLKNGDNTTTQIEVTWINGDHNQITGTAVTKTLEFDVVFPMRLGQHGGHSLIKRLRILYGGMVLEDIQEYSTLARILYDTSVSDDHLSSSGFLLEGTSASTLKDSAPIADFSYAYSSNKNTDLMMSYLSNAQTYKRQIILNAMSGILHAKKLLPLKWMAAQFAIEIELNSAEAAFIATTNGQIDYSIDKVAYLTEMVDFDSSFDYAFLTGLKTTGVPIKFSSWHWHTHNLQTLTQAQIHERARSIKAAFSVIREQLPRQEVDSEIFYHDCNKRWEERQLTLLGQADATVQEYQYRIGGKYHPAQPVDCTNGAAEAYLELSKTINSLGDYSFAANVAPEQWSQHYAGIDYTPTKFVMAMEFENRDVFPDTISGINGEEQSDINLTVKLSDTIAAGNTRQLWTFINYDALLVVKDGNIVELVM